MFEVAYAGVRSQVPTRTYEAKRVSYACDPGAWVSTGRDAATSSVAQRKEHVCGGAYVCICFAHLSHFVCVSGLGHLRVNGTKVL